MAVPQIDKSLDQLPQRYHRLAELMAEGAHSIRECYRLAGFNASQRLDILGTSAERTKYPALWEYYQKLRLQRIRLFDTSAEAIKRELNVIAFSKITDFVSLPTRLDVKRQELFDAKMREQMGYTDDQDKALIAQEDAIRQELSGDTKAQRKARRFTPGGTIRIQCLEDIPEELIPAIASIRETRDGIELKLWNKLDALDKLARINQMFEHEADNDKPTTIENLNLIVNGSKSNLLDQLDKI